MKTPERWRALPRRALFVSILAQIRQRMSRRHALTSWRRTTTSRDVMTSYCDVTWRHAVTSYDVRLQSGTTQDNPSGTPENDVFNMATLTFDLWPWPSNLAEILPRSITTPNFVTLGQTVRLWERSLTDRQTHTHTERRDPFYTLDRWRWREWSMNLLAKTRSFYHLDLVFCIKRVTFIAAVSHLL